MYRRLLQTVREFLVQGANPHELALAIALGVIIGMFPVQGTTTLICTLVAILFRLNLVVIQLANYISFPLMMVMLVPFYTIGHSLFHRGTFRWDFNELILLFQTNFWTAIKELSWSVGYAVLIWLLFAPVGILIIYFISLKVIRRLNPKNSRIIRIKK
jgi:hypothetical protein